MILEIEKFLQGQKNDLKARKMSQYMKNMFPYYGIQSPERKAFTRHYWLENRNYIKAEWRDLFKVLWEKEEREYQYIAMDLMVKIKPLLEIEDIQLLEYFIHEKSWWDTVDFLASHMIGKYFQEFPSQISLYNSNWIESSDLWFIRTAILFQLKYKTKVNKELLAFNILKHKESKEFFINKAAGWSLRQYSKSNPEWVRGFLNANQDLHKLTVREASKYI